MKHISAALLLVTLAGCASQAPPAIPIREIYSRSAQEAATERHPVVAIPGILGTKLVEAGTGRIVWGAFTYGAADADFPDGARLVALPMEEGVALSRLRDEVEPDGVLESLEANVAVFKITAIEPYRGIIEALAAGRYVDRDLAKNSAKHARPSASLIDYGGLHTTCFQFDYDWRRDISESATKLDELITEASLLAARARGSSEPVRVDIVAHSMGGMVLMYYLRYGTQPLPADGSLPELTWAGAAKVRNAILVGTPSAGSVRALEQLITGVYYAPIAPEYRPAVVGTMPALYGLLPRDRHHRVVNSKTGEPIESIFDVATWEKYNWGLADPAQDRYLKWLLPDAPDAAARRRIALDHLKKCLARAEQLHRALDRPMTGADAPPASLHLALALGDALPTPSVLEVNPSTGRVRVRETAPGDGTVTRASALMDERLGSEFSAALRSPLRFDEVRFFPTDHIGLTENPAFIDSLLYTLLERPGADEPR